MSAVQFNPALGVEDAEEFRALHQHLDESIDEFRLLTIIPLDAGQDESEPVSCLLQHFCLNDIHFTAAYKAYLHGGNTPEAWQPPAPPSFTSSSSSTTAAVPDATVFLPAPRYEWGDYLALSYTWSGPEDQREIRVNGRLLAVSRNCEACLRALRCKPYVTNTTTGGSGPGWKFWIDAICINQQDIVERASQVKRMREIYTKAWTPLVWLGVEAEGEGDSAAALGLVREVARRYGGESGGGATALVASLRQDGGGGFPPGSWRALNELVCRRYWRRMWILQEAALGRADTPVLVGDLTLPWCDIARAFDVFIKSDEVVNTHIVRELEEASLPFNVDLWANLGVVEEIQALQDIQLQGRRTEIHRLLNLSRQVFATDPRDKVYGVLGLMDQSLARLIEPDYTATLLDVYRSFTLAIIESTHSLDVLRYLQSTPNNFPSWIPDWTATVNTTALTLSADSFSTSGASRASVNALPDERLLSCKGFIVDRFDGMGAMWSKRWAPESIIPTQGDADPYGSFEAAREAIWKSMVACRTLPSEPLRADYGPLLATPALAAIAEQQQQQEGGGGLPDGALRDLALSNVFEWCARYLRENADFRIAGRRLQEYFWSEAEVDPLAIDATHLRDALMQKDRVGLRRRFATTERGYVGLVLETVEQTDVLAVLLGCSMPMVLRKVDGGDQPRWKVVGECYMHGIMDSEAMEWGLEIQDLVLC